MFLARARNTYLYIGKEESIIACCNKLEKTKTLNCETRISRHFLPKKGQKRAQKRKKKEHKGQKKGAKAKIFFFFSRGNNLHTKFFARRARAFRDSTLVREHTHAHTKTPCARRIRSKEKVRDATLSFFARVLVASLSPTKRGARVEISRVGTVFSLSFSREKRSSKNTKHTTVLAFPIRAKRKRKRRTKRDAKETNAHRRLLRARRKERRAFFFVVPPSALFLSLLIARESWSVIGRKDFSLEKKESALSRKRRGRESESPLKKEDKKRRQKTDCLGYQTDTKIFFSFFLPKKVETGPIN